ncbi:MAG: hypothetical protein MRZ28_07410 [Oscillospiraceae bacterium]|mgnify:FL=1|uniref:Uncharacterized protein n=1 Tax=Myoviridae sp. ct9Uc11 TaxID=2825042 RepID=A0A8S5U999_9CAUD|nr:hypothetical protein [Oscillospiraceae bacterium]MDY3218867.1 hypothetical protein [Candidatus Fimivivens sp.]DAF91035.1 MAG TPA: hypothetical protein [Myoviridae sp. ct9Uc11]
MDKATIAIRVSPLGRLTAESAGRPKELIFALCQVLVRVVLRNAVRGQEGAAMQRAFELQRALFREKFSSEEY